jgi:hypothetical protein
MRAVRKGQDEWPDEDILHALDLRDHEGLSYAQVARATGRTKGACVSMLRRVDADTDKVDVSPHLNGSMPRRWWE